jgi:DNA-binding IclR family transcriptional regulator
MGTHHERGRTLKTTQKSFEIIETLRKLDGAQVSELAEELEMNVSTVHHHVTTLAKYGWVTKSGDVYRLSMKLLTLAGHLRTRRAHYKEIIGKTNELAYETDERAQFIVEERGEGVWIAKSLGPDAVLTDIRVGLREPLHTIAAGKAIMAQLPERRVREIVDDKGFVKRTENTITDTDRLFKELETIRERGFAINDQERIKLEMGLGVPIVDPDDGGPIGALSISAPSQRWNRNDLVDELADHLMEVKTELELSIAYE